MPEPVPGIVIAGVASGVGKTTITLGLLAALRRRGLVVQTFKVGPDFIDPGFHALASGRSSWNLDGWFLGRGGVAETFARRTTDADIAVIEGVMGCFDGRHAASEEGSTAEIAKWLGLPVVLVVDVGAQARSAAAIVHGFERFDPALEIAGVILNRAGGERHAREVLDAIRATCAARPLGALGWDASLRMPERHLGLITAAEGPLDDRGLAHLADVVERDVDLDALLTIARVRLVDRGTHERHAPDSSSRRWGGLGGSGVTLPPISINPAHGTTAGARATGTPSRARARIGVARDAAFQFYYADNLTRLAEAGAELVGWSPISDVTLPDVDGLYIGGGYPEIHAARLAANAGMREAMRAFAASGRPIYAECGGLMYLAEHLEDATGAVHPMVGVLPTTVRMRSNRLTLDYTAIRFVRDTPLGPIDTCARGHEFHASTLDPVPDAVPRAWTVEDGGGARAEGYLVGRVLMSYAHLHFGSNPDLAIQLVRACAHPRAADRASTPG